MALNKIDLKHFQNLTADRKDSLRLLNKTSMRGIRESIIEKYSEKAHFVYELLQNADDVNDMYEHIRGFLTRWLPLFDAENRAYLTISIGCTGGRHRSVYLTERLATHFSTTRDNVSIRHRELA